LLEVPDVLALTPIETLPLALLLALGVKEDVPLTVGVGVACNARAPRRVTCGMTTVTNITALHEAAAHVLLA
jgi:hypothetical protein